MQKDEIQAPVEPAVHDGAVIVPLERLRWAIANGIDQNRDIDAHENSFDQLMSDIMHYVRQVSEPLPPTSPSAGVGAVIVPEGYRLAPKVADTDMAEAARDWAQREWRASGDKKAYLAFYEGVYTAMLSAAPLPPAPGDRT